jgi:hypothetical protein
MNEHTVTTGDSAPVIPMLDAPAKRVLKTDMEGSVAGENMKFSILVAQLRE